MAGLTVVAFGFLLGFGLRSRHVSAPEVPLRTAPSAAIVSAAPFRKVYPLSVIHGGAYNPQELKRARKADAVVAAHYADFGPEPKFQKLTHDTMMYVSYRRANRVYWSQQKHRIAAGETVISDGSCLARARCGNRLSAKPQGPVAPKEPAEDVLNTPESPDEPTTYKLADLPAPGGRQFNLALPATFEEGTPIGSTPVAVPASPIAAPLGASPTYFASGPGSGFGGVGGNGSAPASTTTASTAPSSTTAPVNTTTAATDLPTTTTGGTSLPTSPVFPGSGGVPSDTNTELVPEPGSYAFSFLGLVALGGLRLLRRSGPAS